MKKCRVCGKELPEEQFNLRGKNKHGEHQRRSDCKRCHSEFKKKKWENDPEWKNKVLAENTKYRESHREESREYFRLIGKTEKRRRLSSFYGSKRYRENEDYRIRLKLAHRIREACKWHGVSKTKTTEELLGCTIEFFKEYMAGKFQDGMTWENHGKWHIDHIRPCTSFNLLNENEQKECFHYTNLQPLWAADNIRKSNKWNPPENFTPSTTKQTTINPMGSKSLESTAISTIQDSTPTCSQSGEKTFSG